MTMSETEPDQYGEYEEYEYMSDGQEEMITFDGVIEPYLYEPEYSEEEMQQRRAERERAAGADTNAATLTDNGVLSSQTRTTGDWWCSCGQCSAMPTEAECRCCGEWDSLEPVRQELQAEGRLTCVTQHPDFSAHLRPRVLDTFFRVDKINWRINHDPAGPNGALSDDQYRLVAHRITLEWFLRGECLGTGESRVLPSCAVLAIRNRYPSASGQYS